MRTVILHYHLFKNAGTSLDAAFKENFNEEDGEWVTKEFPAQPALNRGKVKQWIIDNPQAKCFSSHTAIFPVPEIEGIRIIPVIFMRHPIDRIASAYSFEKKQVGDGFGPALARNTTLKGYIETRLSLVNDRQCRNFHAHRLATMFGEKVGDEGYRAKLAIEKLPFVGVVERYSESLEKLELLLKEEGFADINLNPVEKNVSRSVKSSLDKKLSEIEVQIGEELYSKLVDANSNDIDFFNNLNAKETKND
ncbi:Sulfotransferase family protein [Amphritea atlantica]|uniref:Sulfotransferase family protein n=1 Tax=Amphritea atlantica TaxID=355243 RepID=A0A1H9K9M0_9GAMM|nr:sulfotransferase family 2 domain-containing protein [Amphritea atlantica]SEQ95603.1 Sulfotransferase family protein [Amphritea atlantica]